MEQRFLLELDGRLAGRFFDFKGGGNTVDVTASYPTLIAHKHFNSVEFQEMVLVCGTGMSRSFYDWAGSPFRRQYQRKDGAIITLDGLSKPTARLNFQQALVSSLCMPALDASSKDPAYMVVTLKPQRTSFSGSTNSQSVGPYSSVIAKAWRTSSFRIKIDGLEADCQHVTKIDALTLRQKNTTTTVGDRRDYEIEPTKLEFPDLTLELPKAFASKFNQWFQSAVLERQDPSDKERDGTLDFLAPGTATPYFGLTLNGLGIYNMAASATSFKFALHCTNMEFSASGAAVK